MHNEEENTGSAHSPSVSGGPAPGRQHHREHPGSTLTYFSENYSASVNISQIGVSIEENGETVSSRDYAGNDQWSETSTSLFSNLLDTENGEKLALGKKYDDSITVKNSGSIDTFVRVIVTKNWQDSEGNKRHFLRPGFYPVEFPY